LPEQPGSQRARYQPQARPVARRPHGQARRRTGHRRRRGTTPRNGQPRRRTSSTGQRQSTQNNEAAFGCAGICGWLSDEAAGQTARRAGIPLLSRRPTKAETAADPGPFRSPDTSCRGVRSRTDAPASGGRRSSSGAASSFAGEALTRPQRKSRLGSRARAPGMRPDVSSRY